MSKRTYLTRMAATMVILLMIGLTGLTALHENPNRPSARIVRPSPTPTPSPNHTVRPTPRPTPVSTTNTGGASPMVRTPTNVIGTVSTNVPTGSISISQRVNAELTKLGRTKSVGRAAFAVPERTASFPVVALMNESQPLGVFECEGPAKGSDDVTVEETPDRMIITFRCQKSRNALEPGSRSGANKLSIAFQKNVMPQLFAARGRPLAPNVYGPVVDNGARPPAVGGRAPDGSSRDDYELSNCLSAFHRYKSNPQINYFQARFMTRVYRCDTSSSHRSHLLEQSSIFGDRNPSFPKINPSALPSDLRVKVEKLAQLYDPDYKGPRNKNTTYEKSYFVDQSQVTPSMTHDFLIGLAGKPGAGKAMVQISSEAEPTPPKVVGCVNWDLTKGLLHETVMPVTWGPAPAGANLTVKGQGPVQAGTVTVSDSFVVAGLPPVANTAVYVRLVPVSAGKVPHCVGGPSPWVKVDVGNVGYVLAHAAEYLKEEQQKKAEAFKKALGSAGITNYRDSSPIRVTVLSYMPPNMVDGLFTSHSHEELIYGSTDSIYKGHMNLSPSFGWPSEYRVWNNYPECAYNAYELTIAATAYKELPDNAWEVLVYVVDYASFIYSKLQDVIVNAVGWAVSGSKCDANDEHPTGACLYLREGLKTALRLFLAYLGIPPALPSMSEVIGKANEYIATNVVDFAFSLIPAGEIPAAIEDTLRQAMLDAMRKAMEATTHSLRCGLPIPPGKTAKDMGYDEQNTNGCGKVGGDLNPYNWGMKNLAFYERPGIIYLKVERNEGSTAINLSKGQSIEIRDDSGYYLKKFVPISNVARIPSEGWIVPVVLEPNLDKFVEQSRCDTLGALSTCVDIQKEKSLWAYAVDNGAATSLTITTSYKWTDNPAYAATNVGALDANFLQVSWGGYKGSLKSNLGDFGLIKSPPPCPGFKFKECGSGVACGTVNSWH